MGLFAKVNDNLRVKNIIKANQSFVNKLNGRWIDVTNDNTKRKYGVGIGYYYDEIADMFYPPKPYKGWTLNEEFRWKPPINKPNDETDEIKYEWNNTTETWDKYSIIPINGELIITKI